MQAASHSVATRQVICRTGPYSTANLGQLLHEWSEDDGHRTEDFQGENRLSGIGKGVGLCVQSLPASGYSLEDFYPIKERVHDGWYSAVPQEISGQMPILEDRISA